MAEEGGKRQGLGTDALAIGALLTGLIGAVIGLFSPAFVYEIPFFLGLAGLILGLIAWGRLGRGTQRRMAIAGTVLGALALAAGVWGAVQVEGALGGVDGLGDDSDILGEDPATKARDKFCNSDTGDRLDRIANATLDSASQLRRATDRTLRLAKDAPAGAECAVFALDSVADSWNLFASDPGYEDAAQEVRRIRRFQRANDLREPAF